VLAGLAAAGALPLAACHSSTPTGDAMPPGPAAGRPNILVLVPDDASPAFFGPYNDRGVTPHIDQLAQEGIRFKNFFSSAPVCAPTRFGILTGMHATSCGPAHHMRAEGRIPAWLVGFPRYLQQAGYYTVVTAKDDYNADIADRAGYDSVTPLFNVVDRSPRGPLWTERPAGAPFFCFVNYMRSHESSGFRETEGPVSPGDVVLPAYLPDTPEQRAQAASYYNSVHVTDAQIGETLEKLKADGLYEDTIIILFSDNGGILPRSKRFCYDSGHRLPLIVRVPEQWAHLAPARAGAVVEVPATTVDLAPTVLGLAGVAVPDYMHGESFLSRSSAWKRYAFGGRNRMDERYDFSRTARSARFRYIRNYFPHLIYGQHLNYMWRLPAYQDLEQRWVDGELDQVQARFWKEKPFEELYDLEADPDEIRNLASDAAHAAVLAELSDALDLHMLSVNDNGFIPEGASAEGFEESRAGNAYPLATIMELAARAARRSEPELPVFLSYLTHGNEILRYWAVLGVLMLGPQAASVREAVAAVFAGDPSGHVRVAAAEALLRLGGHAEALDWLAQTLRGNEPDALRLQAANALGNIGDAARPALPRLLLASLLDGSVDVRNAARHTAAVLNGTYSPQQDAPAEEQA
jgi:arylsulfatase A-like enzyme